MIFFQFSQLAKDISIASMIIHERRNLLAPVNRLPLDVLCLIPIHLASLSDRLRITFVCRHWRRTFLQYAALWSQLSLTGKTDRLLTRVLLKRARGSPLDITADYYESPIHDVTLLFPFSRQIRSLKLKSTSSDAVQDLSVAISGPLPLLRTIEIDAIPYWGGPKSRVAPTLPLFEGAVNLKNLLLHIHDHPSLHHFAFPNLTTLNFSTDTLEFPVSRLLNFLEASPALRQIWMRIEAYTFDEDVPAERIIVLSHVKTFDLGVTNYDPGCEFTTHISCPFAKHVEFSHMLEGAGDNVPKDAYPPSIPWNAIARQYTKGTVERVVLEITMDEELHIDCSITFRSSERATLKLCYNHLTTEEDFDMEMNLKERLPVVFSQALRTIRNHPLLANVRHLHIKGGDLVIHDLRLAAEGIGRLLGSMGQLENLTLEGCDLRPYLDAFLDTPLFPEAIQPASFPSIKELVIIHPIQ